MNVYYFCKDCRRAGSYEWKDLYLIEQLSYREFLGLTASLKPQPGSDPAEYKEGDYRNLTANLPMRSSEGGGGGGEGCVRILVKMINYYEKLMFAISECSSIDFHQARKFIRGTFP